MMYTPPYEGPLTPEMKVTPDDGFRQVFADRAIHTVLHNSAVLERLEAMGCAVSKSREPTRNAQVALPLNASPEDMAVILRLVRENTDTLMHENADRVAAVLVTQ